MTNAAIMRMQGTSLSNDQVFNVVDCALRNKQVPYATNAVYYVLGASNIQVTSGARSGAGTANPWSTCVGAPTPTHLHTTAVVELTAHA